MRWPMDGIGASGDQEVLFNFIRMPIIFALSSAFVYLLFGVASEGKEILGDEACKVLSFLLGIVVTAYFYVKLNVLKRA